jgi:uncharacterized C2H2 Zn-finger protein
MTEKRTHGTRTKTRSRSGAHVPCPHCGKKVRTQKGLGQHIADNHPEVS